MDRESLSLVIEQAAASECSVENAWPLGEADRYLEVEGLAITLLESPESPSDDQLSSNGNPSGNAIDERNVSDTSSPFPVLRQRRRS
ncbi:MAG: hypothetical protein AAF802_10240 [Planctomycetota bacterium]